MPGWLNDVLGFVTLVGVCVAIYLAIRSSKRRTAAEAFARGEASVMARIGNTLVLNLHQQQHGVGNVATNDRTATDDDDDDVSSRYLAGLFADAFDGGRHGVRAVEDRRGNLGDGVPVGVHPGRSHRPLDPDGFAPMTGSDANPIRHSSVRSAIARVTGEGRGPGE